MEIIIPGYSYNISDISISHIILIIIIWISLVGIGIWKSNYYDIKN